MNPQKALPLSGAVKSALPVEVVSASELFVGQRRMEGQAYLAPGYVVRKRLMQVPATVAALGHMARIWQPPRLRGILVAEEHGIPFLAATQVFDTRPRPRKWLAASRTERLDERLLPNGCTLVTCSGSVGSVIRAYSPHYGRVVSHDLLRVEPTDRRDDGFVYAYLHSRYARAMMRCSQYGNVINHLEVDHLQALPVPLLDDSLRQELQTRVERVYELRDQAYELELDGERAFASAVGCPAAPSARDDGFVTTSRALSWGRRRFDGFHHNPTAASVMAALADAGKVDVLAQVTSSIFWKERFARAYTGKGIPYVHADTLFSVNPELPKSVSINCVDDAQSYFVPAGCLLMACSGQIYGLNGNAVLTTPWHEGKFVSHDVIRIIPSGIRPGYLLTALTHPQLGRPLVLRWAFGTQIPHIEPDDLANVPILRLQSSLEDDIADCAERAAELRYQADCEEDAAVGLVEAALAELIGPVPDTEGAEA